MVSGMAALANSSFTSLYLLYNQFMPPVLLLHNLKMIYARILAGKFSLKLHAIRGGGLGG
jgi:hypothetical protein